MWQKEYVVEANTDKEKIWSLWTDVENWNKWNTGIEYSHLNGRFEKGAWGSFKTIVNMNPYYYLFQLSECVKNKLLTIKIRLSLGAMEIRHEMTEENDKLKIKQYIILYGPLTFIHKRTIGVRFANKGTQWFLLPVFASVPWRITTP